MPFLFINYCNTSNNLFQDMWNRFLILGGERLASSPLDAKDVQTVTFITFIERVTSTDTEFGEKLNDISGSSTSLKDT